MNPKDGSGKGGANSNSSGSPLDDLNASLEQGGNVNQNTVEPGVPYETIDGTVVEEDADQSLQAENHMNEVEAALANACAAASNSLAKAGRPYAGASVNAVFSVGKHFFDAYISNKGKQ